MCNLVGSHWFEIVLDSIFDAVYATILQIRSWYSPLVLDMTLEWDPVQSHHEIIRLSDRLLTAPLGKG